MQSINSVSQLCGPRLSGSLAPYPTTGPPQAIPRISKVRYIYPLLNSIAGLTLTPGLVSFTRFMRETLTPHDGDMVTSLTRVLLSTAPERGDAEQQKSKTPY